MPDLWAALCLVVLLGSNTTVANRGGKLKLLHLPAKLNELLHVTQLITVFEVYDTDDFVPNADNFDI